MKRILTVSVAAMLMVGGLAAGAGLAKGPPSAPPGQDPCSHGNSGKPCRPDPSDNGKDCDPHGKVGGKNEDHCIDTTTPTETTPTETTPTETTPTTPEVTTSTPTDTTPSTSVSTETQATTTTSTPTSPPPSSGPTGNKPPLVTQKQLDRDLKKQAAGIPSGPSAEPVSKSNLPYTGAPTELIALLGLGMTGAGLLLRRRAV